MKLTWKERFRGLDVAVDLGTARTRVFVRGRGLVADEASADFATQIRATRELGWKFIESRKIGGKTLATLSDEEFERMDKNIDKGMRYRLA